MLDGTPSRAPGGFFTGFLIYDRQRSDAALHAANMRAGDLRLLAVCRLPPIAPQPMLRRRYCNHTSQTPTGLHELRLRPSPLAIDRRQRASFAITSCHA